MMQSHLNLTGTLSPGFIVNVMYGYSWEQR